MVVQTLRADHELEAFYPGIAQLFKCTFGQPFDRQLWEQYYRHNPYGAPQVVLAVEGEQVVGHYGLVPQLLRDGGGRMVLYYLAITLMVAPAYQHGEVFVRLVREVHRVAQASRAEFLLAFFNEQSFTPMTTLFRWNLLVETPFFALELDPTEAAAIDAAPVEALTDGVRMTVPYDATYWRWRSRRRPYRAYEIGRSLRLLYKALDAQTLDLVDLYVLDGAGAREALRRFGVQMGFRRVVMTGCHASELGYDLGALERWGAYTLRMCWYPLSRRERPNVHLNLWLSDVF